MIWFISLFIGFCITNLFGMWLKRIDDAKQCDYCPDNTFPDTKPGELRELHLCNRCWKRYKSQNIINIKCVGCGSDNYKDLLPCIESHKYLCKDCMEKQLQPLDFTCRECGIKPLPVNRMSTGNCRDCEEATRIDLKKKCDVCGALEVGCRTHHKTGIVVCPDCVFKAEVKAFRGEKDVRIKPKMKDVTEETKLIEEKK